MSEQPDEEDAGREPMKRIWRWYLRPFRDLRREWVSVSEWRAERKAGK